jgi:hypothetical protein
MLWIDALCINQSDLKERAQQVQMMRLIYAQANRVVIWLGEHTDHLPHDSIPAIRKLLELDTDVFDAELMKHRDIDSLNLEDPATLLTHGLNLLRLPWFRRIWVVQEVYHAKRLRIHLGDQVCSWPLVLYIHEFAACRLRFYRLLDLRLTRTFSELFRLTSADKSDENGYSSAPFLTTPAPSSTIMPLLFCLDMEASDPRDRLFAMRDLVPLLGEIGMIADYEKDVAGVFRDFTRAWIVNQQSLFILSTIHHSVRRTWPRMADLPPPNPDDSRRSSWSFWHDGKFAWGSNVLAGKEYLACGDTALDMTLLSTIQNPLSILLRGRVVSTIAIIGPFSIGLSEEFVGKAESEELTRAWVQVCDPWNEQNFLIANDPHTYELKDDALYYHQMTHASYSQATLGGLQCHADHFFHTSDEIHGLCPHTARPGDLLVVLNGGDVPYILRPCSSVASISGKNHKSGSAESTSVTLVGECYIVSYMSGQAVRDPRLREEVFEIF